MKQLKLNNLIAIEVLFMVVIFSIQRKFKVKSLNFYGQTKLMNEKIANLYEKNLTSNNRSQIFYCIRPTED